MTRSTTNRNAGHQHDRHCYWDHLECGWVCGQRPEAETRTARRMVQEQERKHPLAVTR